jgi:hypothetical protein
MFKILSGCIASTDNLLTIYADQPQDSTIFGKVILMPSKIEIITQFTKRSSTVYVTRLRIDPEFLKDVEAATINIEVVSSTFSQEYPKQDLAVDKERIKRSITTTKHKEIQELKAQIRELSETLRALTEGRALTKLSLQNTNAIAPGMVPVAIDSKGTFIAAYPFNDMIKEINGVTPVGSAIKLFAEDIPLDSGISIQEAWVSYLQTASKILEYIFKIENQISSLNMKLKEIETSLAAHMNTGII